MYTVNRQCYTHIPATAPLVHKRMHIQENMYVCMYTQPQKRERGRGGGGERGREGRREGGERKSEDKGGNGEREREGKAREDDKGQRVREEIGRGWE